MSKTVFEIKVIAITAPITGFVSGAGPILPTDSLLQAINKLNGNIGSKADLVGGKIPAAQLPSYVDDVLEFANLAAFPSVGETGKVFIAIDTNFSYRFTGTTYVQIGGGGTVNWGTLLGSLSAQLDLVAALNLRADKATTITINGTTFDLSANRSWTITGGPAKAVASEVNTGADDAKYITALGLEGSKYSNQNNSKNYAVASGTNIYSASLTPAITAYVQGLPIDLLFTNANTGASTININGLGAKTITSFNILAGQVARLVYDGTNFQTIGTQSMPTTPNKVITTNSAGTPQAVNDLIDYLSTTSEATLLAQDWSTGSVAAAGLAGQKMFGATYEFTCTGTNVWRRTPYNLIWNDFYLANVSDSGTVKTSTQMATLYPTAVQGQRARGTAGVYEYFGLFGWVYFPFTII